MIYVSLFRRDNRTIFNDVGLYELKLAHTYHFICFANNLSSPRKFSLGRTLFVGLLSSVLVIATTYLPTRLGLYVVSLGPWWSIDSF